MNKNLFLLGSLLLACASLASCSKDTEGLTGITYYPVLTLEGDSYVEAMAGTPWVDPGYTATLDGQDYSDHVKVTTSMDVADPKPGYYTVTYSAENADGFSASVSRNVLVTAAGDKASGRYLTSPDSYRDYNGVVYYGAPFQVIVAGDGAGRYYVSDFLGGWYAQRAGYGPDYAATGNMAIEADGSLSLLDSYVAGWGDSLTSLTGSFDAETQTFSWDAEYTDYPFHFMVTMTKE